METYIRKMPHSAFVKLANMLDPQNFWERFAIEIPMRLEMLGQANAEPRYSHQQMATFAFQGGKPGGSPTKRVLQDWGTKNARIRHLITVLMSARLEAAANYIHDDLLQLGPVPRAGWCEDDGGGSDDGGSPGPDNDDAETSHPSDSADICEPSSSKPPTIGEESLPGSPKSNQMSFMSGQMSVGNEGAPSLSQLQRKSSISDEGNEEAWIGLHDIQIQTIPHSMLGTVTDNFNEKPLEKGGKLIGSGGFGMVYLGKFHNGFQIAVKCLRESDQLKEEDLIKQFETEVLMLSQYRHENILHLLGYSKDGPAPCLVYQYLPNGSLEDRLACLHGTPPLSTNMRLKIIQGTANGIAYLNGEKYVHRDIKSANILLDSEFTAKVGDFATARPAPSGSSRTVARATFVIGTPAYLAPEAITFDVSTKLDAYSFGVVLLEVITGLPAQDNRREDASLRFHIQENVEEPSDILSFVDPKAGGWKPGMVEVLYDVACRLLEDLKRNRPNVSEVKPELDALTN